MPVPGIGPLSASPVRLDTTRDAEEMEWEWLPGAASVQVRPYLRILTICLLHCIDAVFLPWDDLNARNH